VQFKQAEDTANQLELDGLVVIGGDDSNTNACLIAEYFRLAVKNANLILCSIMFSIHHFIAVK
jgi:diphosphate-dependent phosphofructokinase